MAWILLLFISAGMRPLLAADAEDRLTVDLFRGYNSLVQPVRNKSELPMIVKIAMQLVLLINVDEREQIMHTNVWLTLKWYDFQLQWNPKDYDGIQQLRVAPDKIWLPDIVLFNNADGTYEVSFMCNALIHHTGEVLWVPPAIYKSSCIIDVEYFPFDDQLCSLTFGSWTYNRDEIKLDFLQSDRVDFSEYSTSSIWDMIDAPAILTEDRSRIAFQEKNAVLYGSFDFADSFDGLFERDCLLFADCFREEQELLGLLKVPILGEKMGLTMNVLLSIVVFLLLVSKILPATSSSIPLVAKYLLLTFVLNIITILITVIICNIYFRSPITHRLPPWVRTIFLDYLPMVMCMQRPPREDDIIRRQLRKEIRRRKGLPTQNSHDLPCEMSHSVGQHVHHPHCSHNHRENAPLIRLAARQDEELSPDAQRALDSIQYITDNMKDDEITKQYRDDWKFVSMVLDRFLLYCFLGVTLGGTFGILLSAPTVFERIDEHEQLKRLIALYKRGLPYNDTYY